MKKLLFIPAILIAASLFNGCLIFNRMSYTINIEKDISGTATVVFYDIRSDAFKSSDLEDDKTNLFSNFYKSPDFLDQMKAEGKTITNRKLFLKGDTLCGSATFNFQDISNVDTIMFKDGYYYLTLTPEDSILSTNGMIIYSKNRKRIIWDRHDKQLKYEMLGNTYDVGAFTKLASFFKPSE